MFLTPLYTYLLRFRTRSHEYKSILTFRKNSYRKLNERKTIFQKSYSNNLESCMIQNIVCCYIDPATLVLRAIVLQSKFLKRKQRYKNRLHMAYCWNLGIRWLITYQTQATYYFPVTVLLFHYDVCLHQHYF